MYNWIYCDICYGFKGGGNISPLFEKGINGSNFSLIFLISTPILWHTLGKIYLPETLWGLENIPMTFLTKMAVCQNWTVVYLWQATIQARADMHNCILHHCFYFTLLFIMRHQSKKGLTIKNLSTPYFGCSSNFLFESLFCGAPCLNSKIKEKLWCNLQLWTPTLSEKADC